jgi:hypothetical protein
MNENNEALLVAIKVYVSDPCLLQKGVVDIQTVALVIRLFLQEVITNITGGSVEIKSIMLGFSYSGRLYEEP